MALLRLFTLGAMVLATPAWASGPGSASGLEGPVLSQVVAPSGVAGVSYGGVVTEGVLGTPLSNVEVTLFHASRPAVVGRTDDLGRFRFGSVRPGLYRLEARHQGFELKVVDPVVVPEHLLRNEHLVLSPVPPPASEPVPVSPTT